MGSFSFSKTQCVQNCNMAFSAVISLVLLNIHYSLSQDALYEESTGHQIQLQNVSLVTTYTGMVVGALMMAGFLYLALNFSGRRAGDGYGGYGHGFSGDDYGGYYRKRAVSNGGAGFMSQFFSQLNKFEGRQEDEE